MSIFQVYSHPIRQTYKASYWSAASLVRLIGILVIVVAPLLVAYRTHKFWRKTETYLEQPNVRFKHQFLLLLSGNSANNFLAWSTFPGLNSLISDHLRIPVVKSIELDYNRDGPIDQFDIDFSIPLNASEDVFGVTCLLFFDYSLQLYSRFRMETMLTVEHQSGATLAKLNVFGHMKLVQRIPLMYRGVDQRYNIPVVNGSSYRADAYQLKKIQEQYNSRAISGKLEYASKVPTIGSSTFVRTLDIRIRVDIPTETILRETGLWEMLKWGWIQYFSILIIFWFVVQRLWEFIFRNHVVMSLVQKVSIPLKQAH